ncbi:MAG: tRNA (adenosine(37)-N6)-dimethylallyltransferase MiaA [Candidatus Firestonebacteria bacterium RIFOXYA2_FULL_40_8]|nr:MAG: tRNA (adenosine(37)-N6)-dimethylallyltransferase MiaA [Candidatus Firestonebacteria bacterium RIFOXYA2_FULL_40_8]
MSLIKNSKELKNATLIVIVGPTASGKTALAIKLAKELCGEIISADSLQIYKEFDIGSAKPDKNQLLAIKHHLISAISPKTVINAYYYSSMAREAISEVVKQCKVPILVGGSGLYVRAAIDGLLKVEGSLDIKQGIVGEVKEKGLASVYQDLIRSDPDTAKGIHYNDEMRIVRALELYRVTNKPRKESTNSAIPLEIGKIIFFGLNIERRELYDRINNRVDKMHSDGLIEEIKAIIGRYGYDIAPLGGLGYRQFTEYCKGLISIERAVYLTKMETRHYAKRQITWFKKDKRIKWLDRKENTSVMLKDIMKILKDAQCR